MNVINEPKEFSFDKIGHKGKIFPSHKLSSSAQFVYIDSTAGLDVSLIQHQCDFFYYILKGRGSFIINDKKKSCKKGDLVALPAGSKYTFRGKLKMLLVCIPPWNETQEEIIK